MAGITFRLIRRVKATVRCADACEIHRIRGRPGAHRVVGDFEARRPPNRFLAPGLRGRSGGMALDAASRARIAPYVSSLTDDVFALSGLPEEVIAVLFAYYSRSRDDLRTNLSRLLADQELDVDGGAAPSRPALHLATEKARVFHEKWVVGYGHASVAEHAVVHLAVENASIVASKVIEDLRLGAFTEKSTRYVVFDKRSFVEPPGLSGDALA